MVYLLGSNWLTLSIVGRPTATLKQHACWVAAQICLNFNIKRTGGNQSQPEGRSDSSGWSQRSGDHRTQTKVTQHPGRVPETGGTPRSAVEQYFLPAVVASLRPPPTICQTF